MVSRGGLDFGLFGFFEGLGLAAGVSKLFSLFDIFLLCFFWEGEFVLFWSEFFSSSLLFFWISASVSTVVELALSFSVFFCFAFRLFRRFLPFFSFSLTVAWGSPSIVITLLCPWWFVIIISVVLSVKSPLTQRWMLQFVSISTIAARFWFKIYSATSIVIWRVIFVFSWLLSWTSSWALSWDTIRKICKARLSTERIIPEPWQCIHDTVLASCTPTRIRWRDISKRPKGLILPTWMRDLSFFSASFIFSSTARLLRFSSISMKSMTMMPARSRRRIWRAASVAASKFVFRAVFSTLCSFVDFPEFTSIATSASVGLITRDPPEGKIAFVLNIDSRCFSISYFWNIGIFSL